jgi:uncharacterized protein (TIGR00290 family)
VSRAWVSWSSGKDSAFALHVARESLEFTVSGLLCAMNTGADRVAMHAVRRELVLAQSNALDLPVRFIELSAKATYTEYEQCMHLALNQLRSDDVDAMIFGDLFLEDVRSHREQLLDGTGIAPIFPLWKRPTTQLGHEMLLSGLRATVTCVDPTVVPRRLVGSQYDERFLDQLPSTVDPCGENGEFHTFAWDGPMFSRPIAVTTGEVIERDGFVFCDVRQRSS